jgi:hypothetical protein
VAAAGARASSSAKNGLPSAIRVIRSTIAGDGGAGDASATSWAMSSEAEGRARVRASVAAGQGVDSSRQAGAHPLGAAREHDGERAPHPAATS